MPAEPVAESGSVRRFVVPKTCRSRSDVSSRMPQEHRVEVTQQRLARGRPSPPDRGWTVRVRGGCGRAAACPANYRRDRPTEPGDLDPRPRHSRCGGSTPRAVSPPARGGAGVEQVRGLAPPSPTSCSGWCSAGTKRATAGLVARLHPTRASPCPGSAGTGSPATEPASRGACCGRSSCGSGGWTASTRRSPEDEGEGDRTRASWLEGHGRYFTPDPGRARRGVVRRPGGRLRAVPGGLATGRGRLSCGNCPGSVRRCCRMTTPGAHDFDFIHGTWTVHNRSSGTSLTRPARSGSSSARPARPSPCCTGSGTSTGWRCPRPRTARVRGDDPAAVRSRARHVEHLVELDPGARPPRSAGGRPLHRRPRRLRGRRRGRRAPGAAALRLDGRRRLPAVAAGRSPTTPARRGGRTG